MSTIIHKTKAIGWMIILALLPVYLAAQSSSESIYSDQNYGDSQNPSWYRTPFLWVGLALVVGFTIYYFMGRNKSGQSSGNA